jgi:Zn-dependent membrane protease YugP
MPFLILILFILALLIGPGLWVKRVLARHSDERNDLPGTGGELAAHLMDRFGLEGVTLERTELGDHYDPQAKAIRLTANVMDKKSLTAIATAAHEFGHALQHAKNYTALTTRTVLAKQAINIQRFASIAIFALPVLAVIPGMAVFARLLLIGIIGSMFLSTLIHFVTLPVEFDASFGRALPILKEGNYVSDRDLMKVRKVLLACALTYVSQAMFGLLNFSRWFRLLRR